MSKKMEEIKFLAIKRAENGNRHLTYKQAQKRFHISYETLTKVRKSISFAEYSGNKKPTSTYQAPTKTAVKTASLADLLSEMKAVSSKMSQLLEVWK